MVDTEELDWGTEHILVGYGFFSNLARMGQYKCADLREWLLLRGWKSWAVHRHWRPRRIVGLVLVLLRAISSGAWERHTGSENRNKNKSGKCGSRWRR